MMITMTHFFHGIKERVYVFIPLKFKHCRDTQLLWRMAFFSYLDGVWEWVQVTSDHLANHYTTLAHAFATTKASSQTHRQVSSIAPPTECSLAITLPSARLSNKGAATTLLQGSIRNVKVHPGSSNSPPPPVNGTPGKNTFSQSQENLHLTRLSQRLHGTGQWLGF